MTPSKNNHILSISKCVLLILQSPDVSFVMFFEKHILCMYTYLKKNQIYIA